MEFVTKGSETSMETFSTGAVRDSQEGKARYDLIYTGMLKRLAELLARGAKKYGEDNWKQGQPQDRSYASLLRHVYMWRSGEVPEEDHLAAIIFNAMSIMYVEDRALERALVELLAGGSCSDLRVFDEYLRARTSISAGTKNGDGTPS